MGDGHRSRVLVTGGYVPEPDLRSGLATVWPEFAEAAQ
jgi:hypothetical protein